MNNNILLVSENKVRSHSNISTNVQSHYVIPAIKEAQLQYELCVGTKLYNKIIELVESGDISLDENKVFKDLLDNSQYFLIYQSIVYLTDIVSVKIDNMGIVQANDEHVQNVSINDSNKIKNMYQNKADRYLKRLEMFIYENWKDYKDYLTVDKYDEFCPNIYSASDTPIYLGGARGKGFHPFRLKDKYENKYYNNYFRY